MPSSVRSRAQLVLACLLACGAAGCSWFRLPPQQVPADFMQRPAATQLQSPATRLEAYRELFPGMPRIKCKGRLTASGRFGVGRENFDFFFFAEDAQHARLRGFKTQTGPLFDVIVEGRLLTFAIHPDQVVFRGVTAEGASPFARYFGVAPGDLIDVLNIGHLVARGTFGDLTRPPGEDLAPLDPAVSPGLQSLVLDTATALPRRVWWARGEDEWLVDYLAWGDFADDQAGGETRLLPRRVRVHRCCPTVNLEALIELYRFNPTAPGAIYDLNLRQPYDFHTLEDLERAFGGS